MLWEALETHFDYEFTWYPHDLVAFWGAWKKTLESHFECEFTWYPHDFVACLGALGGSGDLF